MSKNVVFITSIKGAVDTSYEEYCLNTWKWWCEKNNVELFVLNEELVDSKYMKPTWQRWLVFDILVDRKWLKSHPKMFAFVGDTKIDFLKYAKPAFITSWVIIIIGIGWSTLAGYTGSKGGCGNLSSKYSINVTESYKQTSLSTNTGKVE